MAVAFADIARVLVGARRRQGLVVAATALGYGLAAAGLSLLGGAAALHLGAGRWARPAALALAALALAAAAAWGAWTAFRSAWGPAALARTLGRDDPTLRSDLLSSVELEREYHELRESGRFSLPLVDAHIARAAERARALDLRRAVPARTARQALLAAAAVALSTLLALVGAGPGLGRAYARLLHGEPAPAAAPLLDPITGDIELTYLYPAYMGLPEKKLSGTGGAVSAPKGTEVRLSTRSDRPVTEAQLAIQGPAGAPKRLALEVKDGRALAGRFVVDEPGSYRFRYLKKDKLLAEGPPIPIAVEPDAFPEVRIGAPAAEVEVDARTQLRVEWSASDDHGLSDLTLVTKPPAGEERRRVLRSFESSRRDAGSFELDLAPLRLAEGEKLLYWLEVRDNDAVSGPKRAASATHAAKVYSEAEHHRAALQKAVAHWEEMVRLLGDRLEQLPRGERPTPQRFTTGEALDGRTRALHEGMRETAAELRKDRGAPKELATALANAAGGIRVAESRLTAARQTLGRVMRLGRLDSLDAGRRVDDLDEEMNRELEKDVLYLEQLFDKRRAEDLLRLAKDLSARRRDLAGLLEKYRSAPTEEGKKELLAEIARMRQRMNEMLRRMGELARGMSDEHLNAEALAEVERSRDMAGGLDRVEQALARGDLEGALKELDALGSTMQQMLSALQRTAGLPDEKAAELMREMRAFEQDLSAVQAEQEQLAGETERVKAEYRRKIAERLKDAEDKVKRLEALAREASEELRQSGPGLSLRSEDDFANARDRLADLERALAMRDLDAALDVVRRALPPMQRLATSLDDDALVAERYQVMRQRDPGLVREAARHAQAALPPARKVREELEQLFPDPRGILGKGEQQKLEQLSKRQQELEQRAGGLQRQMQELSRRAPVFPPSAMQGLADSRGHMQQAADELGRRNPQRGHGQQRQALEDLSRLRRGLEEMAKQAKGSGAGGFPMPFADSGGGGEGGEGMEPSRERVEIPGADAYKVPEEFRKDLLEAMKQGVPEPYQGEVKRYYEELVR
jgi:hypothetical protein